MRSDWPIGLVLGALLLIVSSAFGHEQTWSQLPLVAQAYSNRGTVDDSAEFRCTLNLELYDSETGEPLAGLVRIRAEGEENPLFLEGLIARHEGWFCVGETTAISVPRGKLQVEAVHGIETSITSRTVDCRSKSSVLVKMELLPIYDPSEKGLRNGNTHLHLRLDDQEDMGIVLKNRKDGDRLLQAVSASDGLDLVYVSYLTRQGSETESYISNEYNRALLESISSKEALFAGGVEHRHAGQRVEVRRYREDGSSSMQDWPVVQYGHVMLLNLKQRSMPASIGTGLSDDPDANDGIPLREGIIEAHDQGGSVIWCHGSKGIEDIPNWLAGLIHAQNIYDGGNDGTFDTIFYPYLNCGLKVPFSTGTDWGVYDFSRVYVPSTGPYSSQAFLDLLAAGRSFITNEPFLEFTVNGAALGDTLSFESPQTVRIRGRAVGRSDFVRMQVVFNGEIIQEESSRQVGAHFESEVNFVFPVNRSGWLALRIQPDKKYFPNAHYSGPGVNILGKAIFAHTSPVYVSVDDQPFFDSGAAALLLSQVRVAKDEANNMGIFADAEEASRIRSIYSEAENRLQSMINRLGVQP